MTVYLLGEVTAGTRNFRSRRCDYAPVVVGSRGKRTISILYKETIIIGDLIVGWEQDNYAIA